MKIAIMQPYFLPYIGYFQLMNAVDKFVIYDDVNYINRGWINRNNILVNGKANLFAIPLKEASQNKLINEITIIEDTKWKAKLLKTIGFSYKKAPWFNKVYPIIEKIINDGHSRISDFNLYALIMLKNYLGIETEIISTSSKYGNNHLRAQDRIIDICLLEKAATYINPKGGLELYEKFSFEENNLELQFLATRDIEYVQFGNEFIPRLSIIDVIMFNGLEKIKEMLVQYELI